MEFADLNFYISISRKIYFSTEIYFSSSTEINYDTLFITSAEYIIISQLSFWKFLVLIAFCLSMGNQCLINWGNKLFIDIR